MPTLTPREIEAVQMCARGYGSVEIAACLVCSPKSVDVYLYSALRKLGLQRRTQLVIYAHQEGWVDLDGVELPGLLKESEVAQ